MATQESLFALPAPAQHEASMLPMAKGVASANGSGGGHPFSLQIQEPGVDLAKKTVCIKVRLSTMGNTRKVSTSQIEADADKDLLRVSKHLVAQFLWPDQDPIGKHVRGVTPQPPALEVVGVVGEVRAAVEDAPPMMVYEHYWRKQPVGMSFVVRTQTDPTAVAKSIREILSSADPEMAIAPARTMGEIFDDSVAARRYQTYLASAFALSALLLVSLGIFGVISFTVARRIPEIGIRMALGAREGQLMAMIIRQGMIPVVLGLLVGLVLLC